MSLKQMRFQVTSKLIRPNSWITQTVRQRVPNCWARNGESMSAESAATDAQTVRDWPIVTIDHQYEVTGNQSICVSSSNLEWPERCDAMGSIFQQISIHTFLPCDSEWPNSALENTCWSGVFLGGQLCPHHKRRGPAAPKFWDPFWHHSSPEWVSE